MAVTIDGSTGIASPAETTGNLAYTGTLTGGTGVVNLGTGQIVKDASGNVGIGTATPTSKLQVVGDVTMTSQNSDQLAGFRNRIINGACNVQQRGASFVASSGLSGFGGPDRYHAINNSIVGQFTQSAATLTYAGMIKKSVRQTVNTGTTTFTVTNSWGGLRQLIEGYNAYDLQGKFITVSFIFNTNLSGTYSISIEDVSLNSYVSTFTAVANVPIKIVVPLSEVVPIGGIPNTNGTGLYVVIAALNQATYQTATFDTWLAGNFISASGATNWAATAGNFIELTELQVETGSVATPFEQRPYGMELALCQRYYYRVFPGTVSTIMTGIGPGASATSATMITHFPVPMRIAPTALEKTTTAANYELSAVNVVGNIVASAVPTFVTASNMIAATQCSVTSGLNNLYVYYIRSSALSGQLAYLGWSAEL